MKSVKIFGCLFAVMMFAGCAQTRTDVETKLGYVEKLDNQASIAGSHKIEIVRTVSWMSRSACSVLDFVTVVTGQDPSIHDVINIRADEGKTSVDDGEVTGYSCKYWGLAVRYIPIEPTNCAASASIVEDQETPAAVQVPAQSEYTVPAAAPAAPAPAPAPAAAPVQQAPAPTGYAPAGQSFVPSIESLQ